MSELAGKRVLVTGATAGIGEATATAFVRAGAHVIATGRRTGRLRTLVRRLNTEGPGSAEAKVLDVTNNRSVAHLEGMEVDILVNNAGLARGKGPVQEGQFEEWKEMVDTNILGLLAVFKACAPSIIARRGHIVNLGSVAGRWVYPGGNVYSATKFAVRALTESMRIDLQGSGVRVTNIAPGAVDTEFSLVRFKGDKGQAAQVYDGYEPLHATDIADAIVWSCARPPHVDVQEMVIFPTAQASVRDLSLRTPTVVEKATLHFDDEGDEGGEDGVPGSRQAAPDGGPAASKAQVEPATSRSTFRAGFRLK